MTNAAVWWLLAGSAVAVELVTGTFYLLMIAIGLVAAAVSAHAGLSMTTQFLMVGFVGSGAVVAWHLKRERSPKPSDASSNRDVNLDIGEDVSVIAWNSDGTCSVEFRGANWAAVAGNPQDTLEIGVFKIVAIHGSRLTISKGRVPQ